MKNVLGAVIIIGIGVLVYNQYQKSKKELPNVKLKNK